MKIVQEICSALFLMLFVGKSIADTIPQPQQKDESGWLRVGESDDFELYIPTAVLWSRREDTTVPGNLIRINGSAKMWVLYDYNKPVEGARSKKVQNEFDCLNSKARISKIVAYSENMGEGAVIFASPQNALQATAWDDISPSSTISYLYELACTLK